MPVIDMTGKKFNHWTVIERAPNNKSGDAMWLCECDCEEHTRQIVKGSSLRSGHSKSCGCLKKATTAETGRKNSKNLVGQKFGLLTVLEKGESKNYKVYWKCQCSCEEKNIVFIPTDKLLSGHTKSCGCLTRNNLLGQQFGKLTVIEKTDKKANDGCIIWKCKCSCKSENVIEVSSTYLTQGRVFHCGCESSNSLGELIIKNLLEQNNISFIKEKTFSNCKYANGASPRFDFYVDNNYIIEFDGEQHFNSRETGWFTKEQVQAIQEKDNFKNEWCKKNNIPIIRIPYTQLNTLTIEDLLLSSSKYLFN